MYLKTFYYNSNKITVANNVKESFKSIKVKSDSEKSQDKLVGNSFEFTG